MDEFQFFMGPPIFTNWKHLPFVANPKQIAKIEAIRTKYSEKNEMAMQIGMEYMSTVATLVGDMQIPVKIAIAYEDLMVAKPSDIETFLHSVGVPKNLIEFVYFPEIGRQAPVLYIRDMLTCLPKSITLISEEYPILDSGTYDGQRIIVSPIGDGGRSLIRANTAIIGELTHQEDSGVALNLGNSSLLGPYKASGLRVILIPNPVKYVAEQGITGYIPEIHMDRNFGLLEDRKGELHVLMDPATQTGWLDLLTEPSRSKKETEAIYRKIFKESDIRFHTFEKPLKVPMSVGFWQAPDKRVLVTGGDLDLLAKLTAILGRDMIYTTPQPIVCYPAWCKAGIRCLINEFPNWLVKLLLAKFKEF